MNQKYLGSDGWVHSGGILPSTLLHGRNTVIIGQINLARAVGTLRKHNSGLSTLVCPRVGLKVVGMGFTKPEKGK